MPLLSQSEVTHMAHLAVISDQEERIKAEIREEQRRMQEAEGREPQSYRDLKLMSLLSVPKEPVTTQTQQVNMGQAAGPQVPKIH